MEAAGTTAREILAHEQAGPPERDERGLEAVSVGSGRRAGAGQGVRARRRRPGSGADGDWRGASRERFDSAGAVGAAAGVLDGRKVESSVSRTSVRWEARGIGGVAEGVGEGFR